MRGLRELLGHTSDLEGFAKRVNEEIARLWAEPNGQDPEAETKLAAIDLKTGPDRWALEDGFNDAAWANERAAHSRR